MFFWRKSGHLLYLPCNMEVRLWCLGWDVEQAEKNFFVLVCIAVVWVS